MARDRLYVNMNTFEVYEASSNISGRRHKESRKSGRDVSLALRFWQADRALERDRSLPIRFKIYGLHIRRVVISRSGSGATHG
jgi:hypothetical protein